MSSIKTPYLNISVISDIIFDPHFNPLINANFGEIIKIYHIPYGEQNDKEYLNQIEKSNIVIVWLNLETSYLNACNALLSHPAISQQRIIEEIVASCKKLYADISASSNTRILWFLFEDYFNKLPILAGYQYNALADKINAKLSNVLSDNVSFIDLMRLIAEVGITNAYDPKGKYRWNAPYSKALIEAAVKEIHKQYLIGKGITKKCLVLDCDNVLWGGILSEDGIENLKLAGSGFGRLYQDFQRFVLSLYYHGVILAVCSKNDLPDVLNMFREHSEMILKEEHIACFQVNWEDKPGNIRKIAEKLNIGLDSMVFVDDSPAEIGVVKAMLPEVTAILFERDMDYEQFSCFNLKSDVCLADIEKRNETYRTNIQREDLKEKSCSYDEYVKSLDIKTEIHRATLLEYNRISELTQRTNKCTNGKRFTVAEIAESVESGTIELYSVHVSDRFSDLGLVGAFAVKSSDLILFSLSCRALGREIENKMLDFIVSNWSIETVFFQSTGKNTNFKEMIEETVHPRFAE